MRILTIQVPSQEMMTKDSVTCTVDAVVYFHVRDAIKSVVCVQDHIRATSFFGATTLRSVIGESELDELLQKRELLGRKLTQILDDTTESWGVRVTHVEVRDVILPQNMQRVMGSQAEAERDRRAKVISAVGELQAAKTLKQAAEKMSENGSTMQLRYLQTLTQICQERPSKIIFPVPMSFDGPSFGLPSSSNANAEIEISAVV